MVTVMTMMMNKSRLFVGAYISIVPYKKHYLGTDVHNIIDHVKYQVCKVSSSRSRRSEYLTIFYYGIQVC